MDTFEKNTFFLSQRTNDGEYTIFGPIKFVNLKLSNYFPHLSCVVSLKVGKIPLVSTTNGKHCTDLFGLISI